MGMISRSQPLLGTFVEISVRDCHDEFMAHEAIDRAFESVSKVHRLMSFHESSSDLSHLNRDAFTQSISVDEWTYQVLAVAKDLFLTTKGAFDCSIGNQLQGYGLLPGNTGVDHDGTLSDLILEPDHRVRYKKKLCLDLGGIAKGFAVDRAIESLSNSGIRRAVVNAGGDIRVLGQLSEPIYVRHPLDCRSMLYAGDLSNGAIATSAIYFSRFMRDNKQGSALINPLSSQAIVDNQSYSVIAPTCVVADGLTKALAVHRDIRAPYLKELNAMGLIL